MRSRGPEAGSIGWVLLVVACAEPPTDPPEVEGGEVLVEAVAGARACAGTTSWAEAEIARIVAQTGLEPAFDLRVTLGDAAAAAECTDIDDPQTVLGCTVGDGSAVEVFTTPTAFSHELVHALRRHQGLRTRAMFEEGFAELVNGSAAYPRFDSLDPASLSEAWWPQTQIRLGPAEFRDAQSYRIATHFLDFVREREGLESLAAFMRGGIDDSAERAVQRFEIHFGVSLDAMVESWRDAGPRDTGLGDPCAEGIEVLPEEGGVLRVTVDCDREGTMGLVGASESAWTRECVRLSAGRYAVALAAETGVVHWASVPESCEEGTSAVEASAVTVASGETVTLERGACAWALTFASTRDGPEAFELTLTPEP